MDTKLTTNQQCVLMLPDSTILWHYFPWHIFIKHPHVTFSPTLLRIHKVLICHCQPVEARTACNHQKGHLPTLFHLFLIGMVSCESVMLPLLLLCNADPKHLENTNQNICKYNKPGREIIMLWTDQKMSFTVQLWGYCNSREIKVFKVVAVQLGRWLSSKIHYQSHRNYKYQSVNWTTKTHTCQFKSIRNMVSSLQQMK